METITERIERVISDRAGGKHGTAVEIDTLLRDALYHIKRRDHVLKVAAERFEDLGLVIGESGSYANAGFMIASARRCRELDF